MDLKIKKLFKNKNIKEIFWSFLSKGTALILFLITNIILARILGPINFGIWSFVLSIFTIIFTISYFGLNLSTKKFVAQYNNTPHLKNILISSIKLRLIISTLFSILFLLIHKQIAFFLNKPELEFLLLSGTLLIFFSGLVEYLKEVFTGLHRIKYNFYINILEYGLKLILVILFLLFSNSITSIINSYIIALLITTIIGFYLLYFNFYKDLKASNKNFSTKIFKYSVPLIFISIGFIVATEIDTIMIGIFSSATEVGIYAVAKQIILKLPHIATAIAMGTMPIFAKLNPKNKQKLKKKLINLLKAVSTIYGIIILCLIIFSPIFIPLFFGQEYTAAVLPLQILTIYLFFYANSIILSSCLDYLGKAKIRAINMIFSTLLNIGLNFVLIPQFGAVGAATATAIAYLPYAILNFIEIKKSFD